MAFVNERISENDREYFNSFSLKSPFTDQPLYAREWTIDRERDVFLVGLGGRGTYDSDIPMFYALIWENEVILLDTYCKGEGNYSTGIEMWWKITKIIAPDALIKNMEEMLELIKEAFDAIGFAGVRECVTKVNFDFVAEPVFIREVI